MKLMANYFKGAIQTAASKAGLTVSQYKRLRLAGKKKCTICKEWLPLIDFSKDGSRYDGLCAKCKGCSKLYAS